jgi:hypothetical protein
MAVFGPGASTGIRTGSRLVGIIGAIIGTMIVLLGLRAVRGRENTAGPVAHH